MKFFNIKSLIFLYNFDWRSPIPNSSSPNFDITIFPLNISTLFPALKLAVITLFVSNIKSTH